VSVLVSRILDFGLFGPELQSGGGPRVMSATDKRVCSTTNVYVVAENRLLRETLVRLFRKRTDMCMVGNACCAESLATDINSAGADLLLLDCFNSQRKGDTLISELRETSPKIKIVLFGMDEDTGVFLRAVRLGIDGYVLKNASAQELLDAIRSVAQGEAVCPSAFCKLLFRTIASQAAASLTNIYPRPTARYALTQRQRQLMSLVAMGLSNKEIASNLNLSEFTVKNHIYRVMKQVDAESRHEAVTRLRDDQVNSAEWRDSL
jgi:DNA-binding NarL/FixJ family response regulator